MKIAFLGTPDFALPSLKMLYERGDDIVVFTQPDKPVGRKAIMTAPPVKKLALEYGLDVFQFDKIRSEEGLAALKDADPAVPEPGRSDAKADIPRAVGNMVALRLD